MCSFSPGPRVGGIGSIVILSYLHIKLAIAVRLTSAEQIGSPFIIRDLCKKFLSSLDNIWPLVSIKVNTLLDILASISKFLQPIDCRPFTDCCFLRGQFQCRNNDIIYVATEQVRGYCSKILSCQISADSVQN